ncbi:MAG: AI-2E family transporter [Deltaproteobacteria bacterium]|nr:AI-2E family transporter [Candidatus Tharpella aukensis]
MTKEKIRVQDENIFKITIWLVFLILMVIILKNLAFLFIPFSISLLLCYALGIPIDKLRRLGVPNSLRIIIVALSVITFVYLIGRLLSSNILEFNAQLPVLEEKFWGYVKLLLSRFEITPDQVRESYTGFISSLEGTDFKSAGSFVKRLGGSFFSFLGDTIWVILFMIFMLAEQDEFPKRIVRAFGENSSASIIKTLNRINRAVQDYLGLKTMISFGTGVLVTLTLSLFSVPFAILWGVLAFLLNFIPNIGSMISIIPPVLITLFQFGSISKTLGVFAVLIALQTVVGNFVEPKMMGKGLNLSPLTVLLSLLFWGWMWGIPGMLLSVPITAAIKIAFEQIEATRPFAMMMAGK